MEAVGTLMPAYLADPERRLDADTAIGALTHELEVSVGFEVALPIGWVSVTYRERILGSGSIQGLYFGLEL